MCVYNTSGQFLTSFDDPRFTDKDRLYISDDYGVITYKCYQQ